ncbi:Splicing factor U2af small subunit B [Cyberlindnera fabianii]|uniref:Splicing factor U2af small subunit B n=1 Tax=Cyberlindnera fabianii TaxID=36022 RepID=A0A1V2KZ40_CYBFA|nr:Splicing factor U2af small subunit B [Cyberlindnera fabianii]
MSDSVTCQFYTKIGACRHGEKCSRRHIKPTHSRTIIMTNLYQNPEVEFQPRRKTDTEEDTEQTQPTRPTLPKKEIEEQFEAFYKDIFVECALIGEVDEITSCERGGMCNFMHVKRPSRALLKQLKLSQRKFYEDQYKNKTTTNQPEESKVENVRV